MSTSSLDSVNTIHQSSITFTDSVEALHVRVPSAAQVIAKLCGTANLQYPGILMGGVAIRGDTVPATYMKVIAEWTHSALPASERRRREARTDLHGNFLMCGVPLNTDIALRTQADSGSSAVETVRIPSHVRFARTEILHDFAARGTATFAGMVVDSTQQPIAGAQITLPGLSRATVANERGAFRFSDIPVGIHQINVRQFGFGPLETQLSFAANETIDRRIVLSRGVLLETVNTTESVLPLSFEENRKLGVGKFITRDKLERFRGQDLGTVLADVQGVSLLRAHGGRSYFLSTRTMQSMCMTKECVAGRGNIYMPNRFETTQGIVTACYGLVYLDEMLLNPSRPTEPFDVGTIPPDQIEAIEIYPSGFQAPSKYGGRNAMCGVMQLWSRKSH
ncbi:MAG: carboxypeptidase regulatory-like domain-containing protein [bacterium]